MARNQWNLTAVLGASVALASLAPLAYGQTEDKTNTPVAPLRAATMEEMNGGKEYLGMNRPSTLSAAEQLTPDARAFMRTAAMSGIAEVKISQLAQERASSDAVKDFARRMVDDHSKANDMEKHLASDLSFTLPTDMDARHMALYNRLSRLNGAAFDRAYAKAMLVDHENAVSLFTKRANSGRNTDIRSWAATTVPTLRDHLKMAENLYASVVGGSGRTASMR